MTIAANVLLALGGQPVIDRPGFIPAYPSTLPMSIGDGLTVGLAKFSLDLVHDVFMKIEEPEPALEFPVAAAEAALATAPGYATIGEIYRAIIDKIVAFGDGAFTGDPGRQVVDARWFPADELFRITDVETARQALLLVVEEGEGTTQSPSIRRASTRTTIASPRSGTAGAWCRSRRWRRVMPMPVRYCRSPPMRSGTCLRIRRRAAILRAACRVS